MQWNTGDKAKSRGGFTATELIICVSIMAVVSSIVLVSVLGRAPIHRLDRAHFQVLSDLRAARMEAVSKSARVQVTFNSTGKSYTVWVDRNRNGAVNEGEQTVKSLADLPGLSVYTSPNTGAFLPNGTFTSSSLYLWFRVSSGGAYRYVYIFPSGQVDPYNA